MNHPAAGLMEVVQPGVGTTVQDHGRPGHRHQGVPVSGWLDGPLAEAANTLVGNLGGEAVLELRGAGTVLCVQIGPVRVALSGAITAQHQRADGTRAALPAWHSATLQTGDELRLGPATSGCAYLAVAGGLQLPTHLGSRSSYARAGLPDLQGRPLQPGDHLPCSLSRPPSPQEWRLPTAWTWPDDPIRVLLGPQDDHFKPEAIATLLSTEWQATTEQDRMGIRLQGPPLAQARPLAADIASDGVTPGAIQVPANGLPIVLLADAQTVGGYPKIATVIRADLPRLAHLTPGRRLHFATVTREQALEALREQQRLWQRWVATREPVRTTGPVDETALYNSNLVSGVWPADAPDELARGTGP